MNEKDLTSVDSLIDATDLPRVLANLVHEYLKKPRRLPYIVELIGATYYIRRTTYRNVFFTDKVYECEDWNGKPVKGQRESWMNPCRFRVGKCMYGSGVWQVQYDLRENENWRLLC